MEVIGCWGGKLEIGRDKVKLKRYQFSQNFFINKSRYVIRINSHFKGVCDRVINSSNSFTNSGFFEARSIFSPTSVLRS